MLRPLNRHQLLRTPQLVELDLKVANQIEMLHHRSIQLLRQPQRTRAAQARPALKLAASLKKAGTISNNNSLQTKVASPTKSTSACS
jgi:hypothetical protein